MVYHPLVSAAESEGIDGREVSWWMGVWAALG